MSEDEFVPSDLDDNYDEDEMMVEEDIQHRSKRKRHVISSSEDEDEEMTLKALKDSSKRQQKSKMIINNLSGGPSPRSPVALGRKAGAGKKFRNLLQSRSKGPKDITGEITAKPSKRGIVIKTARDPEPEIATKNIQKTELGPVPVKRKIPKNTEPLARTRFVEAYLLRYLRVHLVGLLAPGMELKKL